MSFEVSMILKTTAVLIVAGTTALALRRASASTRHTLWVVALWAALALPPASYMLPKMDLPVSAEDPILSHLSVAWPDALETFSVQFAASQTLTVEKPQAVLPFKGSPSSASWSWQQRLSILWGLGSLIVVIRSFVGIFELRRLRKKSTLVLAPHWHELLAQARKELSISKPLELRMGGRDVAPMTWGIFHNVILLPAAATEWTIDQFRMVLVHELTHVKRNDGATQILVQIANSLYWFNPFA